MDRRIASQIIAIRGERTTRVMVAKQISVRRFPQRFMIELIPPVKQQIGAERQAHGSEELTPGSDGTKVPGGRETAWAVTDEVSMIMKEIML